MKVHVEPYDPSWATEFEKQKKDLEQILAGIPYKSIEHVGSTSVPGLAAKPVLDIAIIVTYETLTAVRRALANAGYFDCGEMNIEGRYAFRQPGFDRNDSPTGLPEASTGSMRRNVYAIIDGCRSLRNHLDMKRMLIQDASFREEYANLKMDLAGREYANIGQYAYLKTELILKILKEAGWSEEELGIVREANRVFK